ncbi:PREDICTED: PNMA-like protein 1 isoform X2 [Condylura cristata]|uniref:PNMA-like protein 1 isoform X2 n=1 Tax=Condylura cristata TaxID=143302 RepID=UPI0006438244|nr:PREDICTED: PNMA-like protein 1 isoform X2 [Condylura cristata]
MSMSLLEDWCRGMEVDIRRSLLVTGIPVDCGHQEIEETLNGVLSPFGPYLVLNKIFVRQQNAKAALIEVGEGVNLSTIPREFPGRGGVWRVVCRDPTQDAEFLRNLDEFLDAEGRTWEDVVRLLQLKQPPPPSSQRLENWAEALGVFLGAVMQMILNMEAEVHSLEEARAQVPTAPADTAGVKVKKEPGPSAEVGSALKDPHSWDDLEAEGDRTKPLGSKASTKTGPNRKQPKNSPKQEAVPWRKSEDEYSSSSASLEDPQAGDAEGVETPKCTRSHRKPSLKQESLAPKKPVAKSARKAPSPPGQDAQSEAEPPRVARESDQDGAQEGPPKKKATGWPAARSPVSLRKKSPVSSLCPVSHVPVDSEGTKKQPAAAKKGHSSRRDGSVPEAWRGPPRPESTPLLSQGRTAKPEGLPQTSRAPRKH